ncbi:MAG: hypothetical protein E7019_04075 [Alphaproteobacteria bacterium]|nr:hypothetical protein [Alphaproteobacteria bacterium]
MKKTRFPKRKAYSPQYIEKKPFFSEKEIIFRSAGRAKVLTISSRLQVIFLIVFCLISVWSFYSYYLYNKSGKIINNKDQELVETRDAYVDLMGDFVAIRKNIDEVLDSISKNNKSNKKLAEYKHQAMVMEDKIKQITSEKSWADDKKISEKTSINEALLQRDIAISERDELRKQLDDLEEAVKEIKEAELEVFARVESIAKKELQKIKSVFSSINNPIKKQGLYFNPLANSKKRNSAGGVYVPASISKIKEEKINKKIADIYKTADDLEYYREVVKSVPIGKPVWSYWLSSKFGYRSDPFNKRKSGHKGVDLASRTGNKIVTKAKGKVIKVQYSNKGYGNNVTVDHGNGFVTKYAHMHKIYVKQGEYLSIDDTIGEVGNTGRSTGPHLHYEILYKGRPVDPLPFMQARI